MKKILPILLSVVIIISFVLVLPFTASAADMDYREIGAQIDDEEIGFVSSKTQNEAVNWLRQQNGASYDFGNFYDDEGHYWGGTQCVEFVRAYVNWLVNGNPWTDAWGGPTGNGDTIWQNGIWSRLGWTVYYNTADFLPQPGDIFSSSGVHTGVVISSTLNTATIADANASNSSPYDGDPVWVHDISWSNAGSGKAYGVNYYIRPNFKSSVPYARPEIVRSYINYQQSSSYRVNVEVTNCESVSSVRVATWTKQDQSDLHWNTCYFNGGATYFIDLSRSDFASNATEYCNDIYVYDTRGENVGYMRIGTIYNNPTIVRTYINYQKLESYRVNIEVTNVESISSVKVATWTQPDQSDLHWNTCYFNGGATYFIDLSRSVFAANQNSYCNDVYVYGANGECVAYERIGTVYNKPKLEEVKISEISKNGYKITARLSSDFGIVSAQFPTWTEANGQDDLVWHNAIVSENVVSCYISASEHNNETSRYITHLYVTDGIGQYVGFTGIAPYIELDVIIGDANGDNSIDVLDAAAIQKYASGKADLTPEQIAAADVNNDNNVDVLDAAEIQKFAAGKITDFKKK